MPAPDPVHPARRRLPGWAWLTLAGVIVGLIVAPQICERFDVTRCSLPWAAATGGWRPWVIYGPAVRCLCVYPPVIEYVLTAVRRVEILLRLPADGPAGVAAVKVPCLLAYASGAWACAAGLAPAWGRRAAAAAAAAYAVCLPIWYDAAVWGQWDAILCLPIVLAAVAAVRDRPGWAGVAAGAALSVKMQAVVILPPLAVYGLRRWGWRGVARGVAGIAAAYAVVALPMLAGGSLGWDGLRRPFTASVDLFHFRTVLACNVWMVAETATVAARQWPNSLGHTDDAVVLGLTLKSWGLAAFAAQAAVVLGGLWHRPTPRRFVVAAGLLSFGLFMLATRMHDRYVVTACALLAMTAGRGGWPTYAAVSVPAVANLALSVAYLNGTTDRRVTMADIAPYQPWFAAVSVTNVAVLAATITAYAVAAFGPRRGDDVPVDPDQTRIATPDRSPGCTPGAPTGGNA